MSAFYPSTSPVIGGQLPLTDDDHHQQLRRGPLVPSVFAAGGHRAAQPEPAVDRSPGSLATSRTHHHAFSPPAQSNFRQSYLNAAAAADFRDFCSPPTAADVSAATSRGRSDELSLIHI